MELHAHEGFRAMANAFVGAVVGVEEPWLPIRRQGFFIDGVAVILRGDEAALAADQNARLVLAAMAVFELVRFRAGGERQNLATEANAENRRLLVEKPAHGFDGFITHFRIAGAVGEHHAVKALVLKRPIPRHRGDRQAALHQRANDVVLAAAIDHGHALLPLAVMNGVFDADLRDEIIAVRIVKLDVAIFINHFAEHAAGAAQFLRQQPRIHAGEAGDFLRLQPAIQRAAAAPMAEIGGKLRHHQRGNLNLIGLKKTADTVHRLLGRHAVIADEWIGQNQNLAFVGRIGKTFGIPDHAGVENHFAGNRPGPAEGAS